MDKEVKGIYHGPIFSVKLRAFTADILDMGQWIHYEADIFFLMDNIQFLRRNLALNVDAAYFADKIIDDISFLEQRLSSLHDSLVQSVYLLERNSYIRFLYKAQIAFAELLEKIAAGELGQQAGLNDQRDTFTESAKVMKKRASELQKSSTGQGSAQDRADQISREELRYLFIDPSDT